MKTPKYAYPVIGMIAAFFLSYIISMDIALFTGFIVVVAGLIYSDRKHVKLEGIVIIRRTKNGRQFIDRVAKAHPGFWRVMSGAAIIVAIIIMILGSALLLTQAFAVIEGAEGGVKLLLPGPVSNPVSAPGVFLVPWWIWIVGITVVIIPHEFMHGVMCRLYNVRIKSVGWLLLILIPGAFVEPDEKQLEKKKRNVKLSVYAAGSFANMIVAAFVFIILFLFMTSVIAPAGVYVSPLEGLPAEAAGINGTIVAIDGQPISTVNDLSAMLSIYKPGDTIQVTTAEPEYVVPAIINAGLPQPVPVVSNRTSTYSAVLTDNEERAYLGVAVLAQAITIGMDENTYFLISTLLFWMFIFSFGIGLVNMLPIGPLDGGLLFRELIGRKRIASAVSIAMIIILLFNLLGPIFL